MLRLAVTILFLANIFVGYFAEAHQGKAVDQKPSCSTSTQIEHTNTNEQNTSGASSAHGECIASHCHFGHCATVSESKINLLQEFESKLHGLSSILSPSDYVSDLLRPPISA